MEFIIAQEAFSRQYKKHSQSIEKQLEEVFVEINTVIDKNDKDCFVRIDGILSDMVINKLRDLDYNVVILEVSEATLISWRP